jgi:hypothetical protein
MKRWLLGLLGVAVIGVTLIVGIAIGTANTNSQHLEQLNHTRGFLGEDGYIELPGNVDWNSVINSSIQWEK